MKKIVHLIILLTVFVISTNAQQTVYKKVKIFGNHQQLQSLAEAGVCLDHGERKDGVYFISDFNATEFKAIIKSGLKYEVLAEDASLYYRVSNLNAQKTQAVNCSSNNSAPQYAVPVNFNLGSMGGFLTYSELLSELDDMAAQYPNLITIKQPIGSDTTFEGRPLYFVKISDNANINEPEPQAYYTALHHAREPLSMQQLVYFMWYLLENYATNPQVQYLVDNREMYFIPCVNPDGYLFNELTDPQGGGMWRKNRRDNLDGTMGVDLNRNYATNWGYDDIGSSPFGSSETYRGTAPASEPEIQMINSFANAHQFKTGLDFHSFGNLLIYPWGHIPNFETPDSNIFKSFAAAYTEFNKYKAGTPNQTVNYSTNGGSIDWHYGEQISKPKNFDFTPECGYSFWPAQSDIIPLTQEAVHIDMLSALVAGSYAMVSDNTPGYLTATSGYLKFNFRELGLDTAATFTVSVTPLGSAFNSVGTPVVFVNPALMQTVDDSISYSLNQGTALGTEVKYLLSISFGSYIKTDTIVKIYGTPTVVLSDDCSNLNNFISGNQWDITTTSFVSPSASITDSPLGLYDPGTNNELRMATAINLVGATDASLSFYAKWDIEPNYDYVQVLASDNNGATWTPLCGKYTHPGSPNQDFGNPVYDGLQNSWVKERLSLNDYLGSNVLIQFRLISDFGVELDGFYFDDLVVEKLTSTVGLNEINANETAVADAIPNPSKDFTWIHYQIADNDQTLVIYDVTGKQVFRQLLVEKQGAFKLNVSQFDAGIYYYGMQSQKNKGGFKKLVILK